MRAIFEKLKKIKHIEIYAAVLAVAVIIAIYFSTLPSTSVKDDNQSSPVKTVTDSYSEMIEGKLTNVIGNIKNAGNVVVMVMTDGLGTGESPPKIVGIVIVAAGAGDVAVRLNILRAVQAIVSPDVNIEILAGT